MSNEMTKRLFSDWHSVRWLTLAVGLLFAGMGIWHGDGVSLLLSGFLLYQAITNTGCLCGRCAVTARNEAKAGNNDLDEIEFTEIKEH